MQITIKSIAAIMICSLIASCSNKKAEVADPEDEALAYNPATQLIYEANPLFFAADSCFDAIAMRLPQIKSLGTGVLWLMPIYTPGREKAVGSPYCVKDYYGINPTYGDMASLKALVEKSHQQGMLVILDWVANHTAWDNAWVAEHPDWYTEERNPTEEPWQDVAILNYDNHEVWQAMTDAMLYWVKEAGIDGFRCDYVEGVPLDFWKEAVAAIRAVKPDAFMLAEASLFEVYEAGFDMIYDWQYCLDLQQYYHGAITFDKLVELTQERAKQIPQGKHIMRYVINHDVISEHSPVELYGAEAAVPGAYVATAFIGQVPMIYSGMEAGFDNRTSFFYGAAKPMAWNKALLGEYAAIDDAWAATAEARQGEIAVEPNQEGAVFSHAHGDKAVLVAVNPTDHDITVNMPQAYVGIKMADMMAADSVVIEPKLNMAPYAYSIYSR